MSGGDLLSGDLKVRGGDGYPWVLVAVLYHSRKGDVFARMLRSLEELDYPPERMVVCFIDNYSKDGAYELCSSWIESNGGRFGGVVHVRAFGNPARLRNVALRMAMDLGFRFFAFIDSDILVDGDFLRRAFDTIAESGKVFSVSAVWDVGFENLDWLEKLYVKWFRSRSTVGRGVFQGEGCNTSACLIDLEKVRDVGFFDEDVWFIEDLDWGRRATRRGYSCLFDGRVVLPHLRKYSLGELRKYFMRGALSEAKLFLKNGLGWRAGRRVVYWVSLLASLVLCWVNPYPALALFAVGYGVYFVRARGWGKLFLFPVSAPFNIAKSLALGVGMVYWLFRGGYEVEKVTVLGEPDWEVVLWRVKELSP